MSTETANDWNDRAIRISAKYYSELVTHDTKLLLLTNDQDNQVSDVFISYYILLILYFRNMQRWMI
jgi:hypothetical protein